MMNQSVKHFALGIVVILGLTACESGSRYTEIDAFIAEIERKPKGKIAPLPEFQPYQAFTYSSSNLRSPFEAPVIIQKAAEKGPNSDVKPPANHVKEFLERFVLSNLSMVGTLSQDDNTWALVEDSQGGVHRVQEGDYMGTSWGKIETITPTRIDLTEIVSDGSDGWLKRPRSIELQSE
jgi:type IV pilus assembly protein PilP